MIILNRIDESERSLHFKVEQTLNIFCMIPVIEKNCEGLLPSHTV
jgi:hypothetical protein